MPNINNTNANTNGSALVMVVLMSALLITFGTILLDTSLQGYKITKSLSNIDQSLYGGNNGIEVIASKMQLYMSKPQLLSFMVQEAIKGQDELYYDQLLNREQDALNQYANAFLDKLMNMIKEGPNNEQLTNLATDPDKPKMVALKDTSGKYQFLADVDVKLDNSLLSRALIYDYSFSNLSSVYDEATEMLKVEVMVHVKAKYSSRQNLQTVQDINAKRTIYLPLYKKFRLDAGLFGIGDIVFDGNSKTNTHIPGNSTNTYGMNVVINGNLNNYGSFPRTPLDPKMWLYGGIVVRREANVVVNGSIYSRSMIRIGQKDETDTPEDYTISYDGSQLLVRDNVIANGIYNFGHAAGVAIGKSAYTFDDLEVNGMNSYLVVNQDYFGLTAVGQSHDSSSAILNSAVLDYPSMEEAIQSRIAVHGNIFTKGAAYLIVPVTFELESVALAMFKTDSGDPLASYKRITNKNNYLDFLKTNVKNFGPLNYVQMRTPSTDTSSNGLRSLITQIRQWALDPTVIPSPAPLSISGYVEKAISANDKIYFTSATDAQDMRKITQVPLGLSDVLQSTAYYDASGLKQDYASKVMEKWNYLANLSDWSPYAGTAMEDALTSLNRYLSLRYASKFIGDQYNGEIGLFTDILPISPYFDYTNQKIYHFPQLESVTQKPMFDYILKAFQGRWPGQATTAVAESNYVISMTGTNQDTYTITPTAMSPANATNKTIPLTAGKYYLLLNDNPSLTFKIDGTFNGMIITRGKIEVIEGSTITGVMIAAGKNGSQSLADVTQDVSVEVKNGVFEQKTIAKIKETVDGEQDNIINGDFASIHFMPKAGIGTTTVTSKTRNELMIEFNKNIKPTGYVTDPTAKQDSIVSEYLKRVFADDNT